MAATFFAAVLGAATGYVWAVLGLCIVALLIHYYIKFKCISKNWYFLVIFYVITYLFAADNMSQCRLNSYIYKDYEKNEVTATVVGKVKSVSKKDYGFSVILIDCNVELADYEISEDELGVLVNIYDNQVEVNEPLISFGDIISVRGDIFQFSKARNIGGFDSESYYKSIGISYKLVADSCEVVENAGVVDEIINKVRSRAGEIYSVIANDTDEGILRAIVLGDKDELDEEIYDKYQRNGIAHILAISGLHVSFVGMALYKGLRRLGVKYFTAFGFSGLFLSLYLIMTGNAVSARRAVIMCLITMGADVLGRTYDMLTAISLSAMLAGIENCYVILNSGFLLSYGAVLGVAIIYPPLQKLFLADCKKFTKKIDKKKIVKKRFFEWCIRVADSLIMSIGISLFTLPVILYSYYQVPIFGVFLNVIVIPLMSLVMFCGMLAIFVGMFSMPFAYFLVGPVHYILKFYSRLCDLFDLIPNGIEILGKPSFEVCVLYIVLLVIFGYLARRKPKKWHLTLVVAAVFLIVAQRDIYRFNGELMVDMIDVGQGDSIFVRCNNGITMLFDGGSSDVKAVGERRILPLLKARGVNRLDYVFISHMDSDHTSGIIELLSLKDKTFSIKRLVIPKVDGIYEDKTFKELANLAADKKIELVMVNSGFELSTGDVSLTCIHPVAKYSYLSSNDYSATYLLEFKDFKMLFTGDIEALGEESIVRNKDYCEDISDLTVLKVAHHGSDSSSTEEFVEVVRPKIAIISCGIKNSYGHPSSEVVERLSSSGSKVLRTDECGGITIKTDGVKCEVLGQTQK